MTQCVVYARVSTKEQADEGYSIDAQLKACRELCAQQGLQVVEEFVEAESAGKAGRRRFSEMLAYFDTHPDVRTVVAHKLDRLTRNFADALKLEEREVKEHYVVSDFPEGPAGVLARDVNLAVAKHYVNNLREEVKKGMTEKVAQGGWPHKAPVGYLNDRHGHGVVVDPEPAKLVVHAFERYRSGLVSLAQLAEELHAMGFRSRGGRKVYVSALDKVLKNPFYTGQMRWKGELYPGSHMPLISPDLFDRVQANFAPNRYKNNAQKRTYVLRDFLYCAECGAKITAGNHKGHTYYRCTHGKGDCSQRSYIREELLMAEVAGILERIALEPDIVEALVGEARVLEADVHRASATERETLGRELERNATRSSALLDNLLDGVVERPAYALKAAELDAERRTLERRLKGLSGGQSGLSVQVEALVRQGTGARMDFEVADEGLKREVLAGVLCNLTVEAGHIGSYQWKGPFGFLERTPERAFIHPWWAIEDLNL